MDYNSLLNKLGTKTSQLGWDESTDKGTFDMVCLIKELWSSILQSHDTSWIDIYIEISESQDTVDYLTKFGTYLKKMRQKGFSDQDIAELLNISQYLALSDFVGVIDRGEASRSKSILGEDAPVSDFGLFFCDQEGNPGSWVGYMHEYMEESAPTGKKEGFVDDDI